MQKTIYCSMYEQLCFVCHVFLYFVSFLYSNISSNSSNEKFHQGIVEDRDSCCMPFSHTTELCSCKRVLLLWHFQFF